MKKVIGIKGLVSKVLILTVASALWFTPYLSTQETINLAEEVKTAAGLSMLKGKEVAYCVKYDENKWEIIPNSINPHAEYLLHRKGEDLFALIIPEKVPVNLLEMDKIVLANAENGGMKNPKIVKKEMKKIGDSDALFLEWEGEFQPIASNIVYLGLIYSGDKGTIQIYTYTTKDLVEKHRNDMMDFINGFCLTDESDTTPVVPTTPESEIPKIKSEEIPNLG
jgi:hypothetical protein